MSPLRRTARALARDRRARWQLARFALVGPVGVVLGWLQYELLWALNPLEAFRPSSTWLVSSTIGVAWCHALHCHVTFRGAGWAAWRETLARAYALYAATIVLGAALTEALVALGAHHSAAWLGATAATSAINFVVLRTMLAPSLRATS